MRKEVLTQALLMTLTLLLLATDIQASELEKPGLWPRVELRIERAFSELLSQFASVTERGLDSAADWLIAPEMTEDEAQKESLDSEVNPITPSTASSFDATPEDPTSEASYPQIDPNG